MLGVSIVLFVVLLAVLFAVAAVTAGFGDLMPPSFQDARPVGLPPERVRPDDLEALRFNVVMRGYKMAEVDAVLHRMAREIAERDAVLAELREQTGGFARPVGIGSAGDETEVLPLYDESRVAHVPPSFPPSGEPYSDQVEPDAGDPTVLMPAGEYDPEAFRTLAPSGESPAPGEEGEHAVDRDAETRVFDRPVDEPPSSSNGA